MIIGGKSANGRRFATKSRTLILLITSKITLFKLKLRVSTEIWNFTGRLYWDNSHDSYSTTHSNSRFKIANSFESAEYLNPIVLLVDPYFCAHN